MTIDYTSAKCGPMELTHGPTEHDEHCAFIEHGAKCSCSLFWRRVVATLKHQLEAERAKVAKLAAWSATLAPEGMVLPKPSDPFEFASARVAQVERLLLGEIAEHDRHHEVEAQLQAELKAAQEKLRAADETIADLRETERRYALTMARLRPYLGERVEVPEVVVGKLVEKLRAAEAVVWMARGVLAGILGGKASPRVNGGRGVTNVDAPAIDALSDAVSAFDAINPDGSTGGAGEGVG